MSSGSPSRRKGMALRYPVFQKMGNEFGTRPAGGHRVDGDAVARPLDGHGPRKMGHGGFAEMIDGLVGRGGEGPHRGHIDDAAEFLLDEMGAGRLGEKEHALDVGRQEPVVFLLPGVEQRLGQFHARIVDEQVQAAQFLNRSFHHPADRGGVGGIRRDGEGRAAAGADPLGRLLYLFGSPRGDAHVRAGLGQAQGHGSPDPAAPSGDDRDPSFKIDFQRHRLPQNRWEDFSRSVCAPRRSKHGIRIRSEKRRSPCSAATPDLRQGRWGAKRPG